MSNDHSSFRRLLLTGVMMAIPAVATAGSTTPASLPPQTAETDNARIVRNYGKLPLRFEANQGQTDQSVKFLARGKGYGLYLTGQDAVLTLAKPADERSARSTKLQTDILRMQLIGSSSQTRPAGVDTLPTTSNYLLGSDSTQWHVNVPNYSKVRYSSVYPGVDLVYYGNQEQLEYDFVVAPGSDPSLIKLRFAGAKSLRLDSNGNLVIATEDGSIAFHKPAVYQDAQGRRDRVAGRFQLMADNSVCFALGSYDHSKPLIIDPTLVYSTYLGGSNIDSIAAIAVDSSGAAYLTGSTGSTDYPVTPGALKTTDTDTRSIAFITKLNASGTALIYSTFVGGSGGSSGGDYGQSIAVDSSGNAYISGYTYSADFPVSTGAYQVTNKAAAVKASTSFVTKINTTGTALLYSTYLGGSLTDNATSVALDSSGDAYVAGVAYSSDFPVTAGVLQTTNKSAPSDDGTVFVAKLNPTATSLLYSTYLGGSHDYIAVEPVRVAVDSAGDAYVSGTVGSTDFPVTSGAYQTTNKGVTGGGGNLTLSKLNSIGTKLLYSTYLGGSGAGYRIDTANGLAIDSSGNAYLTGTTYEANFPVTTGAFETTNKAIPNSLPTAFVTKMNPTGTALVYSTYLGGSGGTHGDLGMGLAVDSSGDAYITGSAGSTDFPVTSNAYQTTNAADFNNGAVAFLTELNPSGSALLYSTYFGGANSFDDTGNGVALGSSGAVYFAGTTGALNFPITPGAYKTTFNSANFTTGFVSEFTLGSAPVTIATTTTLTSSANPAVLGSKMIFNVSVVPATGTGVPAGNVVFNIDQANVATVALNSKGYATYSTSTLAYGAHAILASYEGSTTYSASGNGITETITPKAPAISPASGVYPAAQLVTLTDSTASTAIYYTVDGSTPTSSSTKYTAPIIVSTPKIVQAIAVLSGAPNSAVTAASYGFITAPNSLAVAAAGMTTTTATVNALVNTYGMSGSYHFVYGTSSTALTSITPTMTLTVSSIGSRISFVPVQLSASLTKLITKTKYYYQVVITTPAGTSSGAVLSFTTN
jgi:hypothetical protein